MKKTIILFFALISSISAIAEDVLQVTPFQTTSGIIENEWDEDLTFTVQMNNTNTYTALQFDIFLPEGMTLIDEEPMELLSNRFPGTTKKGVFYPSHTYACTDKGNGHYLITLYHEDFEPIKGNSGDLMIFYYLTSEDMKPGIYPIRISGTVLSIDSHNDVKPATSVSYVTIGEPAINTVYDLGGTESEPLLVPSFVQTALNAENNVVVNGSCQNLVLTDGGDFYAPKAFTAVSANYDLAVSSSLGYKTLVLPFDWSVPVSHNAYEVTGVNNGELEMSQVYAVSANTPVIVEKGGTAQINATNVTIAASGEALTCGELIGTYEKMNAPTGSYVLQNQGGEVAFYLVGEEVHPEVGAFRAYLKGSNGGARRFALRPGVATGINNVNADSSNEYYNLAGQRVEKLQRGISIIRSKDGVKKGVRR